MTTPNPEHVVAKSLTVAVAVERAFQVWTEQIHLWWPPSHSRSGDPQTQVFIEGKVGGRFYERAANGAEYEWGNVVVWDPPHRLAFTWYLGSSQQQPSRVDIQFVSLNAHQTRLELEHRGPELIGALWAQRKGIFNHAWDSILSKFQVFLTD